MTFAEDRRQHNLRRMFAPRSIAVVGASKDSAKAGFQALHSLRNFPGRVVVIHPRESEILGVPCYPNFSALNEPIDLAVMAIPADACVGATLDAGTHGAGGVLIVSGGFGEVGGTGTHLQSRLHDICNDTGLRLLGPNTSGFINPQAGCMASFVPGVEKLPRGRIAVIAQSGGVNLSVGFLLEHLGEGVSLAVGLGNAVDVDSADLLEMLAQDPGTDVIALHLEGVRNGRRLFEVLRNVTPRKPVVALAVGRADIGEFAVSHTGNIMGSWERTAAALTQAGAVVVETTEELAQAAAILAHRRLPPKQKSHFAVVTGQAGPGLLIVDGLKSLGLEVPELQPDTISRVKGLLPPLTFVKNPVDTGRPGETFSGVVGHVAADVGIDAVLVFGLSEPSVLDPAKALGPVYARSEKPLVFGTLSSAAELNLVRSSLHDAHIPAVLSPERLVLAAWALNADASARWRLANAKSLSVSGKIADPITASIDEDKAKILLSQYNIRTPRRMLCVSRAEALQALESLKTPVVAKIVAPEISHKTEAGGVVLNIRSAEEMTAALDKIESVPTISPPSFLIEEMAEPGIELIVGGFRDASWGACIVLGAGGIFAEALSDSSLRLAPIGRLDVEDMIESLKSKILLGGFRGLPRCDRDALADVVCDVGRLLIEHPEIQEVDINPLRCTRDGLIALDALVVLRERNPAIPGHEAVQNSGHVSSAIAPVN